MPKAPPVEVLLATEIIHRLKTHSNVVFLTPETVEMIAQFRALTVEVPPCPTVSD